MNEVFLTGTELMVAALVGEMRRVTSIKEGYNKHKHAEKSDWATDIDGASAELAFAKKRNIYWNASNRTFKDPDVGTWQVRSTTHTDGHLIIRPNDVYLAERFALVITDAPVYRIVGFITAGEARADKYWRGDAWWVPQADLHPFIENVLVA